MEIWELLLYHMVVTLQIIGCLFNLVLEHYANTCHLVSRWLTRGCLNAQRYMYTDWVSSEYVGASYAGFIP